MLNKKQSQIMEIKSMLADEYYDHLILKKSGKALRKQSIDARDQFMSAMAKLREHK